MKNIIELKNGIKLGYSSDLEKWRADTFFTKEPETIAWIDSFEKNTVFYDVGSNIGGYSIYAAHKHKNIKVFSFEPVNVNFEIIKKNIFINKLTNIYPFQIGISDKTKLTNIYLSDIREGNSGAQLDNPINEHGEKFEALDVQKIICMSLDSLTNEYEFPLPNYLKIDVDGLEREIISGGSNLLKSQSLESILIELNTENEHKGILSDILEAGFIEDAEFNNMENHSSVRRSKDKNNIARNIVFSRN